MQEEPTEDWQLSLQDARREKDAAFRTDADSPIPAEERSAFSGLRYYPPNAALRFDVIMRRDPAGTTITLTASQGPPRSYRRFAFVEFTIEGHPVRLALYRASEDSRSDDLFLPFRDSTSGTETYGAGRYLDLHAAPGGRCIIDFNLAYNPLCAYNACYSCPLPPAENWLKVPVRAGELAYPDHTA
ncbi:MAG: DUF1684 domain-containing protein [Candidatus Lutacidiplasmatales archaeon]